MQRNPRSAVGGFAPAQHGQRSARLVTLAIIPIDPAREVEDRVLAHAAHVQVLWQLDDGGDEAARRHLLRQRYLRDLEVKDVACERRQGDATSHVGDTIERARR